VPRSSPWPLIQGRIDERHLDVSDYVSNYFTYIKRDTAVIDAEIEAAERAVAEEAAASAPAEMEPQAEARVIENAQEKLRKAASTEVASKASPTVNRERSGGKALTRNVDKPLSEYESLAYTFSADQRVRLYNKAKTYTRSILNQSEAASRALENMKESKVKHVYEMHTKFSMAVACIIFLLIGGPMGAIVRKGGFGVPILVSIIFFMLYVILTIFSRKINETFVLPPIVAAWLPVLVLTPIGSILTFKAMRDSKLVGFSAIISFFARLIPKKKTA